jgi:hypothetical protein
MIFLTRSRAECETRGRRGEGRRWEVRDEEERGLHLRAIRRKSSGSDFSIWNVSLEVRCQIESGCCPACRKCKTLPEMI